MGEFEILAQLPDIVRVGGGAGLFVGVLLWLLKRGDVLRRENVDGIREQRDEYRRERDEQRERADELAAELARLREMTTGEFQAEHGDEGERDD